MLYKNLAVLAAAAGSALAARPANESICDYYTTALLTNNTAANQYTLLTLLVNTVVIGNYTQPNVGVVVPGILATGEYMGKQVNLLPYFDGGLASTPSETTGLPIAVNFLDGGGAAPLLKNMPSDSTNSAQYSLLTHLYQFFGILLGCSGVGTTDFPSYAGRTSMYEAHKYMSLDQYEVGYFITQVGLAAESFGVATADVTAVGDALIALFDYKCLAPVEIVPGGGAQLQSICIDSTCPTAANSTCSEYSAALEPQVANATLADGEGVTSSSMSASGTATSSSSTSTSTLAAFSGAAVTNREVAYGAVFGAAVLAAFAM